MIESVAGTNLQFGTKRSGAKPHLVASLAAGLVLVDQGSKLWVQAGLAPHAPVEVVPSFFRLTFYANRGAVGGIGQDSPDTIPLLVIASAALVALALLLYRHYAGLVTPSWRMRLFVALTIAPLFSHSIDRLRQGFVVDFLQFGSLPVFNFADVLPHAAIVLLALEVASQFRRRRLVGKVAAVPEGAQVS